MKPTVGRNVWYRPTQYDRTSLNVFSDQPLHVNVVYVHHDKYINVAGFDHKGQPFYRQSVRMMRPDDDLVPDPEVGGYCEWMPYQVGQAKAA